MSSTLNTILGIIVVIVVAAIVWKLWKKKPLDESKKSDDIKTITDNPINSGLPPPTPMVFAINDSGYLDLTDMSGKALDNTYGPNAKTYIGLLNFAEKDTIREEIGGQVSFKSAVGTTKNYQLNNKPYIINYTRL